MAGKKLADINAQRFQIAELLRDPTLSIYAIARKVGCSPTTVRAVNRDYSIRLHESHSATAPSEPTPVQRIGQANGNPPESVQSVRPASKPAAAQKPPADGSPVLYDGLRWKFRRVTSSGQWHLDSVAIGRRPVDVDPADVTPL